MKLVYFIAHPSQYYIFRNIAQQIDKNFEIVLVYTDKDVVKKQIINDQIAYKKYEIGYSKKQSLLFKSLRNFIKKEFDLYTIVKKEKPQIIIGSSIIIAHVGKLLNIPTLIINEDDINVISFSAKIGYPFVTAIISPQICNLGKYEKKAFKYNGYQKLAYLHPYYFSPDKKVAAKYLDLNTKNFLIRLSALSAHHDVGVKGINDTQVIELISYLKQFGNIYISSERELSPGLENYRLKINPLHLHDVLSYVNLLISDSQSMSVEASLLGIPSIRISDFAGKISVLEELENEYHLTYAIKPTLFNSVIQIIQSKIFVAEDYNSIFKERRSKMLSEKEDIVPFFLETIYKVANSKD